MRKSGATRSEANFRRAVALHRAGRLADAERLYQEVSRQQPDRAEALHFLGVIAMQTDRLERAVELIGQAIALYEPVAAAHNNRAIALWKLGRLADSLAGFDRVIALDPGHAETHGNRGIVLLEMERFGEALADLDRAIALRPDYAEAHDNRGLLLWKTGRPEDALASFDQAIAVRPDHAATHRNRGNLLLRLGRSEEALASYDRAIECDPDHLDGHADRGNALLGLGRPEEALPSFARMIALRPDSAAAYYNSGLAFARIGRHADALASFDRAAALRPDVADHHLRLGNMLRYFNRPDEAIAHYDQAIAIDPSHAEAYDNRGKALGDLNRHEDSLLDYAKAITVRPGDAEAQFNRSLALLLLGRFAEGWSAYEWRKKLDRPVAMRSFAQPLWTGREDISGKTLLIHEEQGFGDTIQFSRYAKLAEARGAAVILEVRPRLYPLMRRLSPTIKLVTRDRGPEAFDYFCPVMSLPAAFATTIETIPSEPRYLWPEPERYAAWRARLPPKRKSRIGFAWSGNPRQNANHIRSVDLTAWLPLFDVGPQWICLQKDAIPRERILLEAAGISFFGDELNDFADTAALVELMDLVITVDTSVAHLAGAMGKPVWILLASNPDWRWMLDRDDSPWYPSARLIRQRRIGDWEDVIDRVRRDLATMAW